MKKPRRTELIRCRLTKAEKKLCKVLAKTAGKELSDWMRERLLGRTYVTNPEIIGVDWKERKVVRP